MSEIPQVDAPPQHHLHRSDDPLPGRSSREREPSPEEQHPQTQEPALHTQGRNAFNSERPLDVQPAPEGGVARGGQDDLPLGKANILDKVVGKTEKVIGKITGNAERHEVGELREAGGKKAVIGEARAPHD
ncbi:hypothetical protein F5148DRAFT_1172763 [Russula earlei]|uniref:Uncharacterized protein n=1 Tax=Russula earlei TaxID=71964 RepID=A0ACC0UHU6_9AGAM|nr:hypothetical protein F5148DRAFT_1172763 [Russula earlei]